MGTKYFKHGIHSPFFFSSKCSFFHNSNVFCPCIIHILYTGCAKIKKNNSGAKRLKQEYHTYSSLQIRKSSTKERYGRMKIEVTSAESNTSSVFRAILATF